MLGEAVTDAYLDELVKQDESRLLKNNRFSTLTEAERKQLLYKPNITRRSTERRTVSRPRRSNLLHLSQYAVDGIAAEEEDRLMHEYQATRESAAIRRTAAESGYSGLPTSYHNSTFVTKWQKLNEAEQYRRELYQSTTCRSLRDNATTTTQSSPADRSQTISNSRVVAPYLTLHSVGRYTRYEALQQRHPIHHTGTTPKSPSTLS